MTTKIVARYVVMVQWRDFTQPYNKMKHVLPEQYLTKEEAWESIRKDKFFFDKFLGKTKLSASVERVLIAIEEEKPVSVDKMKITVTLSDTAVQKIVEDHLKKTFGNDISFTSVDVSSNGADVTFTMEK